MSAIVAFVLNDASHDSRVLREAATLTAAGHPVTIVGRTVEPYAASPERTTTSDGVPLVRIPVARGWRRWALLARRPGRLPAALAESARRDPLRLAAGVVVSLLLAVPAVIAAIPVALAAVVVRVVPPLGVAWRGVSWRLAWGVAVVPWARAAALAGRAAAPGATVFWAHDLRALPAAIAARAAAGRGVIVYDAHEIFPEAGDHATRPAWARRRMAGLERELAAHAAALVTVNDELAGRLGPTLAFSRVVVARNCPPRWTPSPGGPAASPLRGAAHVPSGVPLLLYHGGLAAGRGIEALAAALREPGLEAAHLVFMGSGPLTGRARELAAGSGGRIHVLPPVPPGELLDWVAGADVVVAPIQPTTLNHRLSSPNKVFEGIAAGVPIVASDLPGIRSVILADPSAPLGAVTDPEDPAALAASIRAILDLPPAEAEALRARCLAAAHERWNWETESAALVALVDELAGRDTASADRRDPVAASAEPGAASALEPGAATLEPGGGPVAQAICFVLASSGEFDSRTRRFAADLAARGHDVTILARAAAGLPPEERPGPGIRLLRVATGEPPRRPGGRVTSRLRPIAEARRILGVIGEVRAQGRAARSIAMEADVVHAMGFLALPVAAGVAARARARLVYDARDLYVESNNIARLPGPLRTLFAWREGRWAREADRVFTVNEACANELERRYRIRRPVVVMNGQVAWDAPEPRPDGLRERLSLGPNRRIALYHGGLMPDRGIDRLIEAAGRPGLETTDIVIMGSGPIESRLRALAAASAARDQIHFLPPVPPPELLEWVASADVGVMPNQPTTLNERLSTPNKLFECLTAGTPVVSSDFPERRRIVMEDPDGPLGRVCDPTNPAAIAAAIREIVDLAPANAAALRERCRRAGRERYGWSVQLARALEAYGEVTGRPW